MGGGYTKVTLPKATLRSPQRVDNSGCSCFHVRPFQRVVLRNIRRSNTLTVIFSNLGSNPWPRLARLARLKREEITKDKTKQATLVRRVLFGCAAFEVRQDIEVRQETR